ncbi:lysozyme family protein [Cytobacillus oceanisediminis]|uniref:lysozyme family protein n=1 Tax=Cytobacillus oceanisediminis TaxID=665099 RepID=UPI00203B6D3A|nr:lysozyme family protein [Cytobacillus oceanisediminis]MBY0159561.1 lysozyme family protein [Cytobacillus firmus]MCM3403086.1 lysozyme family protein [Cytobacillus oceanisediminis]MCS0822582.1 lysozyme family protein [Cytobacillus firmus]MDK7665925.1 lysozyme family protein [Cytobacillus oceanisediminis]
MKRKKSKKRTKRRSNVAFMLFFLVLIFVLFDQFKQLNIKETAVSLLPNTVSRDVQNYTPILQKELKEVNLEEYTLVLAAIMQQESKGKGGDPMQASESAGLPPNSIQDPEQSIKQGVKHFQKALNYGSQKNVDFPAVIQAYNMGIGYIDFVADQGGKHSEEIAKEFSLKQAEKNPEVYNCGGDKNNFRYPYCYGDFTYTTKVTENIEILTASDTGKSGEFKSVW